MRLLSRLVFASLSLILPGAASQPATRPADLVLFNGRIFTGDRARPWAQSMAVRGDRIVTVGSDLDVQTHTEAAEKIDLRGRLLIPGINDAHDHPGMTPYGVEAHTRVAPMDDPKLGEVAAAIGEEAMAVLTSASAWAEFSEKDKGRLMPGMLADFALLSQDVFQVPEEQIPATRSVLTVVGGKMAYRADGF